MQEIISINNQKVKKWKKLHNRRERQKLNSYLIEGFHLVEESIKHKKQNIISIIVREDILNNESVQRLLKKISDENIIIITKNIASSISTTETNQGIFAEIKIPVPPSLKNIKHPFLLLDAVQDPGNVGTMIRTASAAGFQGVFLGKGTVDLYNDKTLRAAQGSHFQLDIFEGDLTNFISKLKKKNIPILATILDENAKSYKDISVESPFGLIVGNEGAGISSSILKKVDQKIYIPMKGPVESLNVAIASSIIMFHLN